jgi:hypothetical protein
VFGSIVRVHHEGGGGGTSGGNLVERILQTHRAHVERVAVGPPSLEDVFVRHTGRRFEGGS